VSLFGYFLPCLLDRLNVTQDYVEVITHHPFFLGTDGRRVYYREMFIARSGRSGSWNERWYEPATGSLERLTTSPSLLERTRNDVEEHLRGRPNPLRGSPEDIYHLILHQDGLRTELIIYGDLAIMGQCRPGWDSPGRASDNEPVVWFKVFPAPFADPDWILGEWDEGDNCEVGAKADWVERTIIRPSWSNQIKTKHDAKKAEDGAYIKLFGIMSKIVDRPLILPLVRKNLTEKAMFEPLLTKADPFDLSLARKNLFVEEANERPHFKVKEMDRSSAKAHLEVLDRLETNKQLEGLVKEMQMRKYK
jgi:hypothetical protein